MGALAVEKAAGGQPKAAADVEVLIARGTFSDGKRLHGPGSRVLVCPDDAAMLKRIGMVRPDDYEEPAEVQDGTLRVVSGDGPTITAIPVIA